MSKNKTRIIAVGSLSLFLCVSSRSAVAALSIVTTTTDLAALATEIGGSQVEVGYLAQGTQDPHFIEAKPSYAMKINRADLLIANGLDLEIGWLPSLLQSARNPKVGSGQSGFLEAATLIDPIEIPTGKLTRRDGDVHPGGNPHIMLDPVRAGTIAVGIAERLGKLDPAHAADYSQRAIALQKRLSKKVKLWQAQVHKSGVKKLITYHKTLNYFLNRFGIELAAVLEPLPGVPPTVSHIMGVINLAKSQNIKLVMVENFYDLAVAKRVEKDVPGLGVHSVPVSVGGLPHLKSLDDLYEELIKILTGQQHV